MVLEIKFMLGPDVDRGKARLWLYATRNQWPPEVLARLNDEPQDAIVQLGDHRIAARIKAHGGDDRTYVAARADSLRGADWPGHGEVTEILGAMGLGAGDSLRTRVEILAHGAEQA